MISEQGVGNRLMDGDMRLDRYRWGSQAKGRGAEKGSRHHPIPSLFHGSSWEA
jgi:hypothetical protein